MSVDLKAGPVRLEQLLLKKNGLLLNQKKSNTIRNTIKNKEEEDFKQSKPFFKKYGSEKNSTKAGKEIPTQLKQSQSIHLKAEKQLVNSPAMENKNTTKQSFNQKLKSNIIKDESSPIANQKSSFRIKKLQKNVVSPKKARDDFIVLNEEEKKLQKDIFEMHKSSKPEINKIFQSYKLQHKKIAEFMPHKANTEVNEANHQENQLLLKAIQKINHILKNKAKQLAKLEQKILQNLYIQYLQKMPEEIEQIEQSEEEDQVVELPPDRPKIDANSGSYSTAMAQLKNKNYSLNLRRTYDLFQDVQKQQLALIPNQIGRSVAGEQKVKQQGDNRMTLNQKYKDFLFS